MIVSAEYRESEVTARYFNGAGYVVRHVAHEITDLDITTGMRMSRRSHTVRVGIRQGTGTAGGFIVRRYTPLDTEVHEYIRSHRAA